MSEKFATVCVTVVVSLWLISSGLSNFKRVHGKGVCDVVNGVTDIKYIIDRKPFVVCKGECEVDYKQTAYKIFENYGEEFVVLYCGKDKDELPSKLKEINEL